MSQSTSMSKQLNMADSADLGDGARTGDRKLIGALSQMDSESLLSQYLQVLLRRRWYVIGGIVLGIFVAVLVSWMTTPLYRATTTLEIAREPESVVNVKGVEPTIRAPENEFYPTQYGLLKSRSLARSVVRDLRLDRNDTFLAGYGGRSIDQPERTREEIQDAAAALVQKHLGVVPVRNSSLVNVTFDSPDPVLAQRIANSIAKNFIASTLVRRFESTAYARKYLEERLADTRAKLEQSERDAVDYADRQQIINFVGQGGSGEGGTAPAPGASLIETELAAVANELVVARNTRVLAEAKYQQAVRGNGTTATEALTDTTIATLKSERGKLAAEYQRLLGLLQPDYPSMVALKQQIAEVDRSINQQAGTIVGSLRGSFEVAKAREMALQTKADSLKSQLLDLRRRSIQLGIFQRDADTNRILYDGLLQRYKEIGVAGGVGNNNVSVVDPAELPDRPYSPRTNLNILLGLIIGLLSGAAVAFLLEQLDESIMAPHDLEKKLGIPLLGSIPLLVDSEESPIELLGDPKSPLSEAYASAQTALQFTTNNGTPRTILVTSSKASEGKSTTTMALARILASRGKRTLLVDGDLRNPSVHRLLGIKNTGGFSDSLAGNSDWQSLVLEGPVSNMTIMTAGPIPPNPSELLAGKRLDDILSELQELYDYVVIDGPPVMGLADSPLMASHVEGTVFVVAAVDTRAKVARVALRRLVDVQANIVGAILTKFNSRQIGYGYGYGYEYAYDYGTRSTKTAVTDA